MLEDYLEVKFAFIQLFNAIRCLFLANDRIFKSIWQALRINYAPLIINNIAGSNVNNN